MGIMEHAAREANSNETAATLAAVSKLKQKLAELGDPPAGDDALEEYLEARDDIIEKFISSLS